MMRQTADKNKFSLYTLRTLPQTIFTGAEDYGIFFACIGTTCDPFTPPRTTRQGTSCLCTNKALDIHVLKHKVSFEDQCGSLSILTCNYNVLFYPETHSPDKKSENLPWPRCTGHCWRNLKWHKKANKLTATMAFFLQYYMKNLFAFISKNNPKTRQYFPHTFFLLTSFLLLLAQVERISHSFFWWR